MNERVKDVDSGDFNIFHTLMFTVIQKTNPDKKKKKQTTISSLDNLRFPLYKEKFLSFPKHSLPEGLKNLQPIDCCNIS